MSLADFMKKIVEEIEAREKIAPEFRGIIDAHAAARKAWGHPEQYLPGDIFRHKESKDVYVLILVEPPNTHTQQLGRATLVKIVAKQGLKGVFSQWHGDDGFDGDEADFEYLGRRDIVNLKVTFTSQNPETN